MKEIKKFNFIDRSLEMEKIIRTNIGLFALQERLKEEEIYVSSFGIIQCIDVYLRVLCFCKDTRSITDLYIPARKRLYCEILDIEIAREDYDKYRCDIDAYSMKDAFITMVSMIVHQW